MALFISVFSHRSRIIDNRQVITTIPEVKSNRGESMEDNYRQFIAGLIAINAQHGSLQFDKAEFERLPDKQTELQVNDGVLKEVLENLENYLNVNKSVAMERSLIAAQFKNTCMKTSSLSPAIIEAALTIIIDRINDENLTDDRQYAALKQSPLSLSYTDESRLYIKGVRVFQIKKK